MGVRITEKELMEFVSKHGDTEAGGAVKKQLEPEPVHEQGPEPVTVSINKSDTKPERTKCNALSSFVLITFGIILLVVCFPVGVVFVALTIHKLNKLKG